MDRSDEFDIYEDHADDGAFLWGLRRAAVSDPDYELDELITLDERVEAHVDGLRLAGDEGLLAAEEAVDEEKPGSGFVAMTVALERGAMRSVARLIDLVGVKPSLARGVASAMGWAPWSSVQPVLRGLVFPKLSPVLHHLGIAGHAINRVDPGPVLEEALGSDDTRLRARALRAVGECRRSDLVDAAAAQIDSTDATCRFAAASTTALWNRPAAVAALWEIAEDPAKRGDEAVAMAVRCVAIDEANERLARLCDTDAAVALAGAASLGDPKNLAWVLDLLDDSAHARLAAHVFCTVTALHLVNDKLDAPMPEGIPAHPRDDPFDPDVAVDPHDSLPWPNVAGVRAWWHAHRTRFSVGERYIAGQPLTEPWLERLLRCASQPVRRAAAVELAMRRPDAPLFEVRAPGFKQRALLR